MRKKSPHLHSLDEFGIKKVSLNGIRIERIEDRIDPKVPFPHRHDFYQIMIVTQGQGTHSIDFFKHSLKSQDLFLMKPGQMHTWELTKNVKGFIIEFHENSLPVNPEYKNLIHRFSHVEDVHRMSKKESWLNLVQICELMEKEFLGADDLHDLTLQNFLLTFLIFVLRDFPTLPEKSGASTPIEKFKNLLETFFKTEHSVEFYAKSLSLPAKSLTMQISRSLGKSPRDLIQNRILLEAKRHLAFSKLSVSEIGYELGFEDANYFSRFFRIHAGVSPAKFRKEVEP